ncbi:hypothetical protein EDB85DRAFT_2292521 [Lactarius pseudohatsudake]|nr:hypothetical protein EDB85DRAFT_2292521 [Lactarius pseudohatsudake]
MKMINRSRLSVSNNQPPPHVAIITSVPAGQIGTHDDMSAIQTSLAALKDGTTLAVNLPYIAPIASLLLQALTMRDEVKQNKEECGVVMRKLTRIASIIVDLCGKYNLIEEDLPTSLLSILGSLQRELDGIEFVLKDCSRKRGIKGFLLRKDLLTRIKRCDGELSNVLQAFQAELALDTRFGLIVDRREIIADSGPVEAICLFICLFVLLTLLGFDRVRLWSTLLLSATLLSVSPVHPTPLLVAFEDSDGSALRTLLASRSLYAFGSAGDLKRWKSKPRAKTPPT